jgi:peptidoglycan hydrolase-like protein with peptidoglycan-binding domain
MQGGDVRALQSALVKLGFQITDEEIASQLFGEATLQAVAAFQQRQGLALTGVVDEACAALINSLAGVEQPAGVGAGVQAGALVAAAQGTEGGELPTGFVVRGAVREADGSPAVGAEVKAFDVDLRAEQLLGIAFADSAGRYSISYSSDQFKRAEKRTADLVVRAGRRDGVEVLASSPVIFNAKPVEEVDLIVGGRLTEVSEYERYLRELAPLLEDVKVSELTAADLRFLTGETGINPRHLAYLVVAARHGEKTGLAPAAFYGCARQNLPTSLPRLLAQGREELRRALLAALAANVIPAALAEQLEAILDGFKQQFVKLALAPGGASSLGDLLATVLASEGLREQFLSLYVAHEGTTEEFWAMLAGHPDFGGEKQVAEIQFALQVGALTKNHLPLVLLLQQMRGKEFEAFRDLAGYTAADWRALLDRDAGGAPVGFPAHTPGADDEEKKKIYAEALAEMARASTPTWAVASRVINEESEETKDLAAFFKKNSDFKFEHTNVDQYLKAKGGADEKLAGQLKGMQRVYNLTPRYEEMSALLGDGLHSAQAVVRMGQGAFVKKYGGKFAGGEAQAQAVYARAAQTSAMSLTVLAKFAGAFNAPHLPVVSGSAASAQPGGDDIPSWMTLFGSLDLCECVHCRSVYSPAAYLVDVLAFLKKIPAGNATAQEVFLDRRPDIGGVELSCENTNTPLPYVDLVNEVLENAVAPFYPQQQNGAPFWPQTRGSAEELRANPEYTNQNAYDALANQIYPFDAPFNLWLEEARVYLEALGSSRHQIMETFGAGGQLFENGVPANVPHDVASACDSLNVSLDECRILSSDFTPAQPLRAFYGYASETVACVDPVTNTPANLPWRQCLARVPEFLHRANVSYLELLELLDAHFVNPSQNPAQRLSVSMSDCDLNTAVIEHLNDAALQRIHRFVRLWRKTAWGVAELDTIFSALAPNGLDNEFLKKLALVKRLQASLKLPLEVLLSFWGDINTSGDGPLYSQLFLNKTVLNPPDAAFTLTAPPAAPELVGAASLKISEHVPALLAALRLNAADLQAIRAATGLADDPADGTQAPLNLSNVSLLYRHAVLSKSLKLPVKDLLALASLSGIALFEGPARTGEFVEFVDRARHTPFTVAQLNYVFRHASEPKSGAPTKDQVTAVLKSLADGFKQIVEGEQLVPDPEGDITRKKMLAFMDAAHADEAVAILDASINYSAPLTTLPDIVFPAALQGKVAYDAANDELQFTGTMSEQEQATLSGLSDDAEYASAVEKLYQKSAAEDDQSVTHAAPLGRLPHAPFPAALKNRLHFDEQAGQLRLTGAMTLDEKQTLLDWWDDADYAEAIAAIFEQPRAFVTTRMSAFLNPQEAIADLLDAPPAAKEGRFAYVLERLLPYLRVFLSRSFARQTLGESLKLESTLAELLLEHLLRSREDDTKPAIDDFLALLDAGLPAPDSTYDAYALLHKSASLVNGFKMTAKDAAYLLDPEGSFAGLDLNTLPVAPQPAPAAGHVAQFERLRDVFALRAEMQQGDALVDAMSAPTLADAKAKLAEASGWGAQEVEELTGAGGFNLALEDFHKGQKAARLRAARALGKRLGVSPQKLFDWARNDPSMAQAQEIKNTLKAKYDTEQWLAVAKPIKDVLRERQRAALVSYLVVNPSLVGKSHVRDATDLYEHFLIDVEMSACQMTTRVKQAISSAQLFVQRALMNLEPEVSIDEREGAQWKWMKNYRVWEANRKVFLYPENWIEPELRDDKTPFFKSLENDLLQGELTDDRAETAFQNYLEKLDEVAHLEVCGIYHQLEYPRPKIKFGQPPDPEPQGEPLLDVLHVFGRTRGTPRIYFYRRRVDSRYWTPWEKIDLDIESDHLIPMIYNRRLHLFWPVFTEKALEEVPAGGGKSPSRYWEIQLSWSEYRNKKWFPKKKSRQRMILDPSAYTSQDQENFGFAALIDDNELVIRCYAEGMSQAMLENPRSWPIGEFRFTGCNGSLAVTPGVAGASPLLAATGTNPEFMEFVEDPATSDGQLYLFTGDFAADVSQMSILEYIDQKQDVKVLQKTPGRFRLLVPHQGVQFASKSPLFYADDRRTFFVTPRDEQIPLTVLGDGKEINPGSIPEWMDEWQFDDPLVFEFDEVGGIGGGFEEVGEGGKQRRLAAPDGDGASGDGAWQTPAADARSVADAPEGFGARPGGNGSNLESLEPTPGVSAPLGGGGGAGALANAYDSQIAYAEMQTAEQILAFSEPGAYLPDASSYKTVKRYLFETFYHPYVCDMISRLNRHGVPWLLRRDTQKSSHTFFSALYSPVKDVVKKPYPREDVDFVYGGAYSQYNWELFFHVPLLIADRLGKNQRFEEAQKWFHYIFDPTDRSPDYDAPRRYWKTRPFFEKDAHDENIQDLMELLSYDGSDPEMLKRRQELEAQVEDWRENPFNPHLVARLRNTAYQKSVVMKYIDNLVAWADQLFRRDTIESINEATQLYLLAAEILGKRPETIPEREYAPKTFDQLKDDLDAFSNAAVEVENTIPAQGPGGASAQDESVLGIGMTLYFCVPKNDKLLAYWDTVADRLFKIRHCMNIEGVVRQLPMFEPPIDPALLVKAFAMGVDLGSVLNDANAPLPHYRFPFMLQKANELCADLKGLGQSLIIALEKRDAEELSLLRSSHEIKLLDALRQIKEQQIEEAKQQLEGFKRGRKVVEARHEYYKNVAFTNDFEKAHMDLMIAATIFEIIGQVAELAGAGAHATPTAIAGGAGSMGSPVALVQYGGENVGNGLQAFGKAMGMLASLSNLGASLSSTLGAYHRRFDEWKLQERLAARELDQVDRHILAAQIRVAITERELEQHDLQTENAKEVDVYLRDKFTNRELYDWMVSQISAVYFQSYQTAYDVAKRAERTYQFELGAPESSFIQFGHWDSLRKGLLAGEKLSHDLRRMEVSYLDRNRRGYEITKHVSLAMLDPVALVKLKETGECFVRLPEMLFDLDYPGHYARRIKSAAVSIPSVTGPYTGVNCTLTMLSNTVRRSNLLSNNQYARNPDGEDARFADGVGPIQSIVTSGAQNDWGTFEQNFRDERYLPFEGAGVVSEWRVELPRESNRFDLDTVTDVVLHLRYTAREGGELLRSAARQAIRDAVVVPASEEGAPEMRLVRVFSARHEFPNEWHRFLHSPAGHSLRLDLSAERFPFRFPQTETRINEVAVYLKLKPQAGEAYDNQEPLKFRLWSASAIAEAEADPVGATPPPLLTFQSLGPVPPAPSDQKVEHYLPKAGALFGEDESTGVWRLDVDPADFPQTDAFWLKDVPGGRRLDETAVEDILIVVGYRLEPVA